jgi:sugar phosphate isomerase/epimerase
VSDIVRAGPAPDEIDPAAWSSCVDGALPLDDYLAAIRRAGFESVEVAARQGEGTLFSITARARRK